ncbi:hypothetical protein AAG570_006219 [Ranatra chinensis]|uniref:Uncharacterized protein n=1 Tax=Ranatra chinensis TaxID=642074 RepID=A0ABD0YTA8_9HEMI
MKQRSSRLFYVMGCRFSQVEDNGWTGTPRGIDILLYYSPTKIIRISSNRNQAQGCHINSNSNISKPNLILSNVTNQFNNFDQAFNMPNNTKRGLSNNCLNYASSSIDHNQIPKSYLLICPTELLHKSPLIYQNPIIIPHSPINQITDLT